MSKRPQTGNKQKLSRIISKMRTGNKHREDTITEAPGRDLFTAKGIITKPSNG